uniref:Uncharacterized protein n=1 Tax=Marseillevirus LCMAC101 TaxID=2506602 RepID=A0A481YRU5_9VIRU|nr:MAG: hypothetical protein LCMAC101_03540 [Marseillevirus LCMAC101]
MDLIKIPTPSELPQSPDPLNAIRQKVADEIRRASVYQKHVSVVFKKDPLFCTGQFVKSQNFGYTKTMWDLDMFEKIVEECLGMGYLNVRIKEGCKTVGSGGYGVSICDSIVMYISWDVSLGNLAR